LFDLDLSANKITGAAAGICAIKGHITSYCHIAGNPAWTNASNCPTCLNTGPCKPPVTCTGPSDTFE
jgi:hypothetical protein